MDLKNQGNSPDFSSSILFKKKRGRPRKDQSENPNRMANLVRTSDQIQAHGEYGHIPPGFATVNGNPPLEGNAVPCSNGVTVGQTVTGVVEATFDAGYLLSVRIGNSETRLTGVVFKPGQFAPISTDTDMAHHIQMLGRNLVSFLSGHQTPLHPSYRRGRGRGKSRSESSFMYSDNGLVTCTGKQLHVAPAQPDTLFCDRGTLVPVVLEPANQANCVAQPIKTTPVVSQPAHLAAPVVSQPAHLAAPVVSQPAATVVSQPAHLATPVVSQPAATVVSQPSHLAAPVVSQPPATVVSQPAHLAASKARLVNRTQIKQLEKDLETGNSIPPTEEARKIDGSTVKLPGAVMEDLVNQVLRRIQSSTESKETRIESGQASGALTYGYERMQDLNEPFFTEVPLHAVRTNHFNESPSISRYFGCARPGKMTELLLAVQENVVDKQTAGVQHHVFSQQLN